MSLKLRATINLPLPTLQILNENDVLFNACFENQKLGRMEAAEGYYALFWSSVSLLVVQTGEGELL